MISKLKKRWKYIIADIILINTSLLLAFLLRFEEEALKNISVEYFIEGTILGAAILGVSHVYKRIWRYASASDIAALAKSILFYDFCYYILLISIHASFSKGVLIIKTMLDLFLLCGLRVFLRMQRERKNEYISRDKEINVLIVGAGAAGEMVLNEIERHRELSKNVVGFIDDDPKKIKMEFHGKKVFGNKYMIPKIVKEKEVEEIVIAVPSAKREHIREIYEYASKTNAKIKIVPGIYEILNKSITMGNIRDINVEDLLGREAVKLDTTGIEGYIKGKIVFVTGGAGSIGSEVCRQVLKYNPETIVIIDVNENNLYMLELELMKAYPAIKIITEICNIRELEKVKYIFKKYKPNVVFHAAAHKHVPLMEKNPEEAIKNNVFGSKNLLDTSEKYGVERFVLISTDKAVNPTNIMGATKRIAEMLVQVKNPKSKTKYMAVRFGNVLGSEGSVIPIFKRQIEKREDITLTHSEITRYFMTIPEASQLVLQAGALGSGGEVFVLDMGEPVKIIDLAKNLVKLSGLELGTDINIQITGLRPGEKLYEELLYENETMIKTDHEKINIAKMREFDIDEFNSKLIKLKIELDLGNYEIIKAEIKDIVDTYKG